MRGKGQRKVGVGGATQADSRAGRAEVSEEGTLQTPQCPSLAVPCPVDSGTEASKDSRDGDRVPGDSEVSVISHPKS